MRRYTFALLHLKNKIAKNMYSEKESYDNIKKATHGGLEPDMSTCGDDEVVPDSAAIDMRDFERANGYFEASSGSKMRTSHWSIIGEHKNYPTIKLAWNPDTGNWQIVEKYDRRNPEEYSPVIEPDHEGYPKGGIRTFARGETLGEVFNNPSGGLMKDKWEEMRWEIY